MLLNKNILIVGIIILFILSALAPITFGSNINNSKEQQAVTSDGGLMDSAWPMESHDVRHTGRSPYNTAENPGIEIWRFKTGGWADSSPAIGKDGTIYFGSDDFYAVYPNGTLKWKKSTGIQIKSCPAIDENGVLYIGDADSFPDYMWAINPNGTKKWRYKLGGSISSSPVIGTDGTIYFGCWNENVIALNPNGTLRWKYKTNHVVLSSPAIGEDGTIYCGSHDKHLHAIYPNGTMKWKFKTGDWIRGNPSIADNGIVYIGSFDGYFYSLFPNNGTMKWKCKIGRGTSSGCSIANDGTIYVGGEKLYAIYPNGTKRWSFDLGDDRWIGDSSPAISADGIIFIGACIGNGEGGELIAVNSDGTERWRSGNICNEAVMSSPAIAEDGTVYICSVTDDPVGGGGYTGAGYLHAFGTVESNNPPNKPEISGKTNGESLKEYEYKFMANDSNNNPIGYYIEWGDGETTGWTRNIASGVPIYKKHTYFRKGVYTIKAKVRDTLGEESDWGELKVTMPRSRATYNSLFLWFLEQFPILQKILLLLQR